MTHDGVVTHAEVMRWLPDHIRRDLELAMPPEQRGWYTETEMLESPGRFVEAINMAHREVRYFRTA